MVRKLVVMFTSVVVLAAANVKALGLGEVTLESALNQPLVARVELLQLGSVRPDQISVSLASVRDFDRFSIERSAFLNSIEFNIETRGGETFIRMSTDNAVREPFVSLVLDTRWPSGRLLSEYTMLLDLPTFAANDVASAVSPATVQPSVPASVAQTPTSQNNSAPQRLAAQSPSAPSVASDVLSADAEEPRTAQATEQTASPPVADDVVPLASNDPVVDGTVTVGTNDTLWDIARAVRPNDSVSMQQTMLALQRLNTEAFIADNINMVRRGQVLRVPNIEQIRSLSARDAVSEVSRQNQLFENRRNVPLASQPLAAQPAQSPDATSNRGELSIVSDDAADQDGAQSANGSRSAELRNRVSGLEDALAVQREETDRVTRRADELSERLRLLEEQIVSAKEIIRLRDIELAQLQQSLEQQNEEAAEEVVEAEPIPEPVITMAPEKSTVQKLIDTLMENSYALIGAVVLLVLALVFVLLRRNKKNDEEELDDIDAMATSVEEQDSEESLADTAAPELDEQDQEDLDEIFNLAEGVDDDMLEESFGAPQEAAEGNDAVRELLEEADALIAHERYDEAVSLLQDGIVAEPNSSDLRLKLLEVCVAKKDAVGFKLQETELRETATPEVLERIEELKAQLRLEVDDEILEEGDEEFFSELADEDVDDLELALDMDASAEVDDAKVLAGHDAEEVEEVAAGPHFYSDDDEDLLEEDVAHNEPVKPVDPAFLSDDIEPVDDEEESSDAFDLSTESDEETIEFAVEEDLAGNDEQDAQASEESDDDENLLDFDFTKDEDANPVVEDVSEEPVADENSVDFDLSDLGSEPAPVKTAEAEQDSENEIEFEFDMDEEAETSKSAVESDSEELEDLEFGAADSDDDADEEFSIEFEAPAETESPEPEPVAEQEEAKATDALEESDDEVMFEFDDEEDEEDEEDESDKDDEEEEIDWDLSSEEEQKLHAAFDSDDADDSADLVEADDEEDLDIAFDEADIPAADPVEDDAEEAAEKPAPVTDEFDDLQFLSGSNNKSSDDEDELDDEALEFLSDADEAATKLDLARAYFEMGDREGAQEILEEVIKEGSEEQIKDAKALLEKL